MIKYLGLLCMSHTHTECVPNVTPVYKLQYRSIKITFMTCCIATHNTSSIDFPFNVEQKIN